MNSSAIDQLIGESDDIKNTKGLSFDSMDLSEEILKGIREKNFDTPSPIQEEAIPTILKGFDVLARAKNGTGKSASFLIPLIQLVHPQNKTPQAIIIVPTRELAVQTAQVLADLSRYTAIQSLAIYGGSNETENKSKMNEGVQIIISTPGKLINYVKRGIIVPKNIKHVVIDEADTIVSTKFDDLSNFVISHLTVRCQILLFSATFPKTVAQFRDKYMKNVVEINLMKEFTLKHVNQFYACTAESDKLSCFFTLFSKLNINQTIIFCNSVNRVILLTQKINEFGTPAKCIHSKMSQDERLETLRKFQSMDFSVLVSTDLFNRGIDIPSINIVINFDMPSKSATYLHRIGRTGRFGVRGIGISLITPNDKEDFLRVKKELSALISPIPKDFSFDS